MLQLLQLFKSDGWEITFGSAANRPERCADLSELVSREVEVELNSSSFDELIRDLNPDAVLFDRFMTEEQFGWRVAKHCPNAIRMLDTEDLHCLREARGKALKASDPFRPEDLLAEELALREVASIYRSDVSIMISEVEIGILKEVFNVDDSLISYLPFLSNGISEEREGCWKGFDARQDFVTIGNFLHPPNLDAVKYLKNEIWPLIRKELPKVEMHVYGAYGSDHHMALNHARSGFLVKGFAEDVNEVMSNARLCLAPLRFGAGLKGKLLDAMMNGTPSVTTSIGAEGMKGAFEWPGSIENEPEAFAQAAVQAYKDEKVWIEARNKIRPLVNSRFDRIEHGQRFLAEANGIRQNLASHRKQNFVGAMLNHHTMRSTEFMSRWIETKNRLSAD